MNRTLALAVRRRLRLALPAALLLAAACASRSPQGPPTAEAPSASAPRGSTDSAVSGELRQALELAGPGAELYGAGGVPTDLSRRVAAEVSARVPGGLEPDRCLERAAEVLLASWGPNCRMWPRWMEEPVLHHAGCYDAGAYSLLFCSDQDDLGALFRHVGDALDQMRDAHLTHLGAARRQGEGGRWIHAVLIASRRVELAPFPRSLTEQSRLSLSGEALEGGSVTAYRMDPMGRVKKLPVVDEPGGRFRVPVSGLIFPGQYSLELMIEDRDGPHVAALFPVYVDQAPPVRVEPPPPVDLEANTAEQGEVLLYELVNLERGQRGLPLLDLDPSLSPVAREYARAMRDQGFFAHVDPRGRGPRERAAAQGYNARILGENLARAPRISEAHEELMASPTHRANLLDPRFTHIGIGVVQGEGPGGKTFWVVEEMSVPQRTLGEEAASEAVREAVRQERRDEGLSSLDRDRELDRIARALATEAGRVPLQALNDKARTMLKRGSVPYRALLLVQQVLSDPGELGPLPGSAGDKTRMGVGVDVRKRQGYLEYAVVLLLTR